MNKTIRFYGASWCTKCIQVKNQLNSQNIEFEYIDLDDENNANEAKQLGIRNIPCMIATDGSRYIGDNILKYFE